MTEPLVSILIPTYNRSYFLLAALQSAFEPQEFSFEILVGDNASTDNTELVCQKFFAENQVEGLVQKKYIRHPQNLGMVANWNTLLAAASGKYIKVLCDDDELALYALAREVNFLRAHPEIKLCASARLEVPSEFMGLPAAAKIQYAKAMRFSESTKILSPNDTLRAMVRSENIFGGPSAVLFLREALPSFPTDFQYAADWAAWLTLSQSGDSALLADPGCWFRLHELSLTSQFVRKGIDLQEVFRLRWRALLGLEKALGHIAIEERAYLGLLLFYRLTRRFAKLLCQGGVKEFLPLTKSLLEVIHDEKGVPAEPHN